MFFVLCIYGNFYLVNYFLNSDFKSSRYIVTRGKRTVAISAFPVRKNCERSQLPFQKPRLYILILKFLKILLQVGSHLRKTKVKSSLRKQFPFQLSVVVSHCTCGMEISCGSPPPLNYENSSKI